jgi:hypothetical protein
MALHLGIRGRLGQRRGYENKQQTLGFCLVVGSVQKILETGKHAVTSTSGEDAMLPQAVGARTQSHLIWINRLAGYRR